jgi:hypothetical protein
VTVTQRRMRVPTMTADPTNDGACFLRPVMTSSSRSCEDRLSVFIGDRLITHIATLAPRSSKVCTNASPNLDQTADNIDEIVSVYGVLRPTRFFSDVVGSPAKPPPQTEGRIKQIYLHLLIYG